VLPFLLLVLLLTPPSPKGPSRWTLFDHRFCPSLLRLWPQRTTPPFSFRSSLPYLGGRFRPPPFDNLPPLLPFSTSPQAPDKIPISQPSPFQCKLDFCRLLFRFPPIHSFSRPPSISFYALSPSCHLTFSPPFSKSLIFVPLTVDPMAGSLLSELMGMLQFCGTYLSLPAASMFGGERTQQHPSPRFRNLDFLTLSLAVLNKACCHFTQSHSSLYYGSSACPTSAQFL